MLAAICYYLWLALLAHSEETSDLAKHSLGEAPTSVEPSSGGKSSDGAKSAQAANDLSNQVATVRPTKQPKYRYLEAIVFAF